MAAAALSAPHFHNEEAAYAFVEARVWPQGPVCPHCGGVERIGKMGGASTRIGTYKCYQCRKPFTVKIGTIFEASHVPLHLWLQAMYLMCASKKGISSNQLHRILGVTLKTAWFMSHRIREAMRSGGLSPLGGEGATVEVDETFISKAAGKVKTVGVHHMRKVLSLVDRGTGEVRSTVITNMKPETIWPILEANIARETRIMTDDAGQYRNLYRLYPDHHIVRHERGEYGRSGGVTTNTIEGYFSIFKRGMKGVYQHCAEKHLHRYLAEFDFRYSNRAAVGLDDGARAEAALRGIVGKRLTYQTACVG